MRPSCFSLLIVSIALLSLSHGSNLHLPPAPQKPFHLHARTLSLSNSSVRARTVKAVKHDTQNVAAIIGCGGSVEYGAPVDGDTNKLELWRASRMQAHITFPMIKLASAKWIGSKPYNNISPPGFITDVDSRGHLLAQSLGGSGISVQNIVAMEKTMNTPLMAQYEQEVASIYRTINMFCAVQYTVTARYENAASMRPDKVEIDVQIYNLATRDDKTLWLNVVLNNLQDAEIGGVEQGQSPNRLISVNAPRQVPEACILEPTKLLSTSVKNLESAVQLFAAINIERLGQCA